MVSVFHDLGSGRRHRKHPFPADEGGNSVPKSKDLKKVFTCPTRVSTGDVSEGQLSVKSLVIEE